MHRQAARALVPLVRADARTPLNTRRVIYLTRGHATAREGSSTERKGQTSAPYKPHCITEEEYKNRFTKRFWKTVGIENQDGGYVVTLDGRPIKTLSSNTLIVPPDKRLVAALIASEWENQETVLKPHALPVTSIAGRAFDDFQDPNTRGIIRSQLLKYLETDSIFYHADEPAGLVRLQEAHWKPIIDWAQEAFGVEIKVSDSLVVPPQAPETMKKFKRILTTLTPAELAAMERATYASKSFLIGLALVMRHLDVEQAAQAAHVEVNSQIERWGEVEDSHDVDYHDMRRQLGSAACLLVNC